ncbi:YitT family protein [Virgibacillus necropolis]|uniref:YitT family protein n=1 Tax=Virgibacillus necropolis TaxID=163877 RepID=UPI00384A7172
MFRKMVAILIGSLFIALGINLFIIPNHLIDGGIIGIGLIAKYTLGLKPGLTIIVLSLPIYLFAWKYVRPYFYNGLHGLLISSFFIDLFHPLSHIASFPILISALSGGVIIGIGISFMLTTKSSAGGTDLLALMISKTTRINVGILIFLIDIVVIFLGWILIPNAHIFSSGIMIAVTGLTTSVATSISEQKKCS